MANRSKFKAGQVVEFKFAGSNTIGEIGIVRPENGTFKYNIIDDEGTNYPVAESNILRKL